MSTYLYNTGIALYGAAIGFLTIFSPFIAPTTTIDCYGDVVTLPVENIGKIHRLECIKKYKEGETSDDLPFGKRVSER